MTAQQRTPLPQLLKEKELWFLILLWLAYCYRPLFLNETFFFRDVTYFFFPQENLFGEILRSGEFPFWDTFRHGGHPYLADLNNSPLYPTNLLFLILPAVKAFSVFLVLHYMLCSFSAYLFSRVMGLHKASSFLVGIVYGFCGYILSLNDHPTRLAAMALLPLILLFWHLFLVERKRRFFVSAALVGVLQVILGAPEVNVLMMLTLLGWAFAYPFPGLSPFRRIVLWGLLALGIIGMASFQLFPTLEAVSQSSRGEGLDYRIFAQWSLHPSRLPEMLFPAFRGYLDRLPYNIYFWGGDLGDLGYPYIPNIYFGCVVFALALIGACHSTKFPVAFRSRAVLTGIFLTTLILALGRFWPFFPSLHRYIPMISIFRYPIKFLLGGIFPLSFLAGCGAEVIFAGGIFDKKTFSGHKHIRQYRSARNLSIAVWSVLFVLGAFTLLFRFSEDFASQTQMFLFTRPGTEVSHAGLSRSFIHATAVWLIFASLVAYRFFQPRRWQQWALVCVLSVDLLSAGQRVSPLAPASYFTREPALAERIRREIGDGKLYRAPDPLPQMYYFPVGKEFERPADHIMWLYRWQLETLRIYLASNYHIPVIFHRDYNMMAQRRIIRIKEMIEALPWERRVPLLSAGGVNLILSSKVLDVPGLEQMADIPNWSDRPLFLYRNTRVAPRVGFVTHWKEVESDIEAERLMLKADFDPRRQVVLQKPQESLFSALADIGQTGLLDAPADALKCHQPLELQVQPKELKTNSSLHSVTSNCGGYLVFTEQLYPGWRVDIDGRRTAVKRANFAFSAVWLEPGAHDVRRYYAPTIFFLGIFASFLSCGIIALLLLKRLI
ncbi:MAG: YfhO family protein [bacterium]|nr:YfhO family protein [bacterium]